MASVFPQVATPDAHDGEEDAIGEWQIVDFCNDEPAVIVESVPLKEYEHPDDSDQDISALAPELRGEATSPSPNGSQWRGSIVAFGAVLFCSLVALVHRQWMMWACSDVDRWEHIRPEIEALPLHQQTFRDAAGHDANVSSHFHEFGDSLRSPSDSMNSYAMVPTTVGRSHGGYQHSFFSAGRLLLAAPSDNRNGEHRLVASTPSMEYDLPPSDPVPRLARAMAIAKCSFCVRSPTFRCAFNLSVSVSEILKMRCSIDVAHHCIPMSEESVQIFKDVVGCLQCSAAKQEQATIGASSRELVVYTSPSCPAPTAAPIVNQEDASAFSEQSILKQLGRDAFAQRPRQFEDLAKVISSNVLGAAGVLKPLKRLLELSPPEGPNVLATKTFVSRTEAAHGKASVTTLSKELVPMPYSTAPHAKSLVPMAKLRNLWPCVVPKARSLRPDAVRGVAAGVPGASKWRRPLSHRIAYPNSSDPEGAGACSHEVASESGGSGDARGSTDLTVAARRYLSVRSSRQPGLRIV